MKKITLTDGTTITAEEADCKQEGEYLAIRKGEILMAGEKEPRPLLHCSFHESVISDHGT